MPKKPNLSRPSNYCASPDLMINPQTFLPLPTESRGPLSECLESTWQLHYLLNTEEIERKYRETGNPWYAWLAFYSCTTLGSELPEWTGEYLRQVGQRVLGLTHYSASAAEYMLGFRQTPDGPGTGGGPAMIKKMRDNEIRTYAIDQVIIRMHLNKSFNLDKICEEVADDLIEKYGIKELKADTVRKWYYTR